MGINTELLTMLDDLYKLGPDAVHEFCSRVRPLCDDQQYNSLLCMISYIDMYSRPEKYNAIVQAMAHAFYNEVNNTK